MRAIVADYDFRRWIGLVKRAVDGLANVGRVVKAGDEYGDRGFPRKTPQCDRRKRPRYRCNCHTVKYPRSILSDRISPASCANRGASSPPELVSPSEEFVLYTPHRALAGYRPYKLRVFLAPETRECPL